MSTNINKQKWPEPRPIEEAPKEGTYILGWDARYAQWKMVGYSAMDDAWIDDEGISYEIACFLPLPPKPEARK